MYIKDQYVAYLISKQLIIIINNQHNNKMNVAQAMSTGRNPALVPMILHTEKGDHKILVSQSTPGSSIIAHVQTKVPRDSKNSVFIWIKYKGSIYPLHREVNARFLAQNYKEADGKVHLQLKNEDSFGY